MSIISDAPDFLGGRGPSTAVLEALPAKVVGAGGQSTDFFVGQWEWLHARISGPNPGLDAYPVDFAWYLDAARTMLVGTNHMELEPTIVSYMSMPALTPYLTVTWGAGSGPPAQTLNSLLYLSTANVPAYPAGIDPVLLADSGRAYIAGGSTVFDLLAYVRCRAVLAVTSTSKNWFAMVYRANAGGGSLGPLLVLSGGGNTFGNTAEFLLPCVRARVQITNQDAAGQTLSVSVLAAG